MEHSTRNLIIAVVMIGGFLVIHHLIIQRISGTEAQAITGGTATGNLPDFAAIDNTKARKNAFFEFLRPMAQAENRRLQKLRDSLDSLPESRLKKLADDYGLPEDSDNLQDKLRKHIDQIPVSLVLAQAAIESAWGTSRFARQGNNLFGQWCFTEGCGMVPRSRAPGATHEVRTFDSARDAIRSYMHNLNSHRAYAEVRHKRQQQRQRDESLSGCYLSEGLESYSEKGARYVDMVKSMIRTNSLEDHKEYCAPRVIATPGEETRPAAEKDASASDNQGDDAA